MPAMLPSAPVGAEAEPAESRGAGRGPSRRHDPNYTERRTPPRIS